MVNSFEIMYVYRIACDIHVYHVYICISCVYVHMYVYHMLCSIYIHIHIAQSLKRQGISQCRIMPDSNDYMII